MQGEETPGRVSKKFLKANARQLNFQGGDDNGSQGKD